MISLAGLKRISMNVPDLPESIVIIRRQGPSYRSIYSLFLLEHRPKRYPNIPSGRATGDTR